MRTVGWRVGAATVASVLAAAGLWMSGGSEPAGAAGGQKVRISHAKFVPAEVTIAPGETVTWVNEDHDAHSVTADDGSFDSHPDCSEDAQDKCLPPGGSWSQSFANPGRYPYHSRTEGQKGMVVVRG
ncbi:MAG: plastocyanin/azurin family copper-binding protein [Actinomycetota bacterium]|jgi:plastocyanin